MLRDYGQLSGDRRAQQQYLAQHPQMLRYRQLNDQWETSTAYGRYYSLLFQTAALKRWLAATGETEAQAAHQLEAACRPAPAA